MRNEVLFSLFTLPVTSYAICISLSLFICFALFFLKTAKSRSDVPYVFAVLSVPLGLIGARLFWLIGTPGYLHEYGLCSAFRLSNGGYAIWGAIGGAVSAAVLASKITKSSLADLLDSAAPFGALAVALCRFSEYFSGEGVGTYLDDQTALHFFPLAVANEYEEWQLAVFMLEGTAALVTFIILLFRRSRQKGSSARLFMIIYSSVQVILESLRLDNFLRWLFLRVSQLTAVLVMAGMILAAILRYAKLPQSASSRRFLRVHSLLFLLGVGTCVALEFAFEKSAYLSNSVGYLIMFLCCILMGFCCYRISIGYSKHFIDNP